MKIILASQSGVRKKILDDYKIQAEVVVSNIDEDEIKTSEEEIQKLTDFIYILLIKTIKINEFR